MTLGHMHTRILIGVGAWLLGAAAATGGSMLAVSKLGQGILGGPGQQQLTSDAVSRALASETVPPTPAPRSRTAGKEVSATPVPSRTAEPDSPGAQSAAGTLLASAGGTVVARCDNADAYLVFWSPQQGFEVGYVLRGPATVAKVAFRSPWRSVTMTITCDNGSPSASTDTSRSADD